MNTKLGMLKLAALAALCAVGVGAMPFAHADSFSIGYHSGWHGHSRFGVSVGVGPVFYGGGGYYAPAYNNYPSCYYDYYGNYSCRPAYPVYYGGPGYYGGPVVAYGVSYYGGGGWWDHGVWHGGNGWRGGQGNWNGGQGNWHGGHSQHGNPGQGGGHGHDGGGDGHWHH